MTKNPYYGPEDFDRLMTMPAMLGAGMVLVGLLGILRDFWRGGSIGHDVLRLTGIGAIVLAAGVFWIWVVRPRDL